MQSMAPKGEFILFKSKDGKDKVECRFESDTLWLSQAMICDLYGKAKATISEHISNIFSEGELDENTVVRFYRTTAADDKAKKKFDQYAENRRRLKETEGEKTNIATLNVIAKDF